MWVTTSRSPLEKDRKERNTTFCMMREILAVCFVVALLHGEEVETTTCLAIFQDSKRAKLISAAPGRCFVLHQVGGL